MQREKGGQEGVAQEKRQGTKRFTQKSRAELGLVENYRVKYCVRSASPRMRTIRPNKKLLGCQKL